MMTNIQIGIGTDWVHHRKQTVYEVLALTNLYGSDNDTKFPPTVVYQDSEGKIWSRPVKDFLVKFSPL